MTHTEQPAMKAILRDFPASFNTERLTIRAPRPGDGAELNAAVLESWAELRPWLPWALEKPSPADSEAIMRQAHARFLSREDLWMLLFLQGTNTLVGSSGLHVRDWSTPRFEIGYWLRSRFAGQGYMTEAVLGLTDFAFDVLGARRLEIHCDAANEASAAVARRAHYTLEGALHNHHRHHLSQELRHLLIFARVKAES